MENTVSYYDKLLTEFESKQLQLPNRDFDTGNLTSPGEYPLADKTYARLVRELAKDNFAGITPALRANILAFYSDPSRPTETRMHKQEWKETSNGLQALNALH